MTIEPGDGPLWDYLSRHPQVAARLIEWGESCKGAEHLIDSCSVCGLSPNWSKTNGKIPDWLVGYSTSWNRSEYKVDAGAWVIRCERCGTKFCSHVHNTHHLEKLLNDPRWPKA